MLFVIPISDVHEMSSDSRGGGHGGRDQVRAAPFSLSSFEISIAGGSTPLAWFELVRVHCQAHAATRFSPFEAGVTEDTIESLLFGLRLYLAAARHHHRRNFRSHMVTAQHVRRAAQILDASVGARADEDTLD